MNAMSKLIYPRVKIYIIHVGDLPRYKTMGIIKLKISLNC